MPASSSTTTAVTTSSTTCPNTLVVTDTEGIVSVAAGTFAGVTGLVKGSYNGTDLFNIRSENMATSSAVAAGTTITLTDNVAACFRVPAIQGLSKIAFVSTGFTSGSCPVTVATGAFGNGAIGQLAAAISGTFSGSTFTGTNTFSTMPLIPSATVAAAGTNAATAGVVTTGFTQVTAADDTKGIVLPAAVAGAVCIIKSTVSNKILKIWPATGDGINAIAVDSALSLASGPTPVILVAYDNTTWYSIPLLPS